MIGGNDLCFFCSGSSAASYCALCSSLLFFFVSRQTKTVDVQATDCKSIFQTGAEQCQYSSCTLEGTRRVYIRSPLNFGMVCPKIKRRTQAGRGMFTERFLTFPRQLLIGYIYTSKYYDKQDSTLLILFDFYVYFFYSKTQRRRCF